MADLATQYRKFIDAFNARDHDTIDSLVADKLDFKVPGGITVKTKAELRAFDESWVKAFPDSKITVEELVVSGSTVFARGTASGTHTGPLQTSMGEVGPTGRKTSGSWLEVARYEGDLYTGGELIYDRMEMAEQLGLVPATASA